MAKKKKKGHGLKLATVSRWLNELTTAKRKGEKEDCEVVVKLSKTEKRIFEQFVKRMNMGETLPEMMKFKVADAILDWESLLVHQQLMDTRRRQCRGR